MVRLGFALVYLAFAYALVTSWFGVTNLGGRGSQSSRGARIGTAAGSAAVLVGFSLPSVSGFPEGTLSGWSALDPFSTVACVLLAVLLLVHAAARTRGGEAKRAVVAGLAASLAGLVVGNTVIQSFTERGTRPAGGLWLAAVGAAVSLAAAVVDLVRGPR